MLEDTVAPQAALWVVPLLDEILKIPRKRKNRESRYLSLTSLVG
jgi:hypothetical protein